MTRMTIPHHKQNTMTDLTWPHGSHPFGGWLKWQETSDRTAHRVGHIEVEGTRVLEHELASSVEGTPSDPWPPSPPVQQTHCQQMAGMRTVWMGLGMAGRSHWSCSIEATGRGLEFDCACRVAGEPAWLGSTYRLADKWIVEASHSDLVALRWNSWRIELLAGKRSRLEFLADDPAGRLIRIAPLESATTTCWSFRWELVG